MTISLAFLQFCCDRTKPAKKNRLTLDPNLQATKVSKHWPNHWHPYQFHLTRRRFFTAILIRANLENKKHCHLLGLLWYIPIARYVYSSLKIPLTCESFKIVCASMISLRYLPAVRHSSEFSSIDSFHLGGLLHHYRPCDDNFENSCFQLFK